MSCERNFSNSVVLLTVSPALHTKFAAYPKSWTGPWTLDSGLWTLVFFPLKTSSPPQKKPLYLPHETPHSPHKHFFPQI